MTLTLQSEDRSFAVQDAEVQILRYTFLPDTPQCESPKPFLHPIRTRAGRLVSLFRPHDHVWHKGIAWSLPVVGDENFWGGPSYVRGRGYVQLPNDGSQEHRRTVQHEIDAEGVVGFTHDLEWIAQDGRRLFAECRRLTARVLDDAAWALTFSTELHNVSDADIPIGSPTTRGRENAGYGGLFWRGPRAFTGGTLVTATGAGTGNDVRGQRHEWMAFAGWHDAIEASSLLLIVDDRRNPHHPPQWFARSEEFACLNPAPFFSDEVVVPVGASVRFRYAVGIADAPVESVAEVDRSRALAAQLRTLFTEEP